MKFIIIECREGLHIRRRREIAATHWRAVSLTRSMASVDFAGLALDRLARMSLAPGRVILSRSRSLGADARQADGRAKGCSLEKPFEGSNRSTSASRAALSLSDGGQFAWRQINRCPELGRLAS